MAYSVITSPLGKVSYYQNLEYLKTEWTFKEIERFILKTEQVTEILKVPPTTFKTWEHDPKIYCVPIVKQITLFYSIFENTVEILLFWNNYQGPQKLQDLL